MMTSVVRTEGQDDGAHFMAEVRREKRGEDGLRDQEGSARAQDFVTLEPALICLRQVGQRQSPKFWPTTVNCDSFSRT